MTCIIGLAHDGLVTLGADSFFGSQYKAGVTMHPKVGSFSPPGSTSQLGWAFSGAWHPMRVFQHPRGFPAYDPAMDVSEYISYAVLDHYMKSVSKQTEETEALIAFKGRLFILQGDYSCCETSLTAHGSGYEYGLGVMKYLEKSDMSPTHRIMAALRVAGEMTPTVCGPYMTVTV